MRSTQRVYLHLTLGAVATLTTQATALASESQEEPSRGEESADEVLPREASPAGEDSERPSGVSGYELVAVRAGVDLALRSLGWSDGLTSNLRDYRVVGVPGFAGALDVYPFATLDVPVLSDLGLTFEGRGALGLTSATEGGAEVATRWHRFAGGLRYRQRLDASHDPVVLGFAGSFVHDDFAIAASPELAAQEPSARTASIRGGVDVRVPLGPLALTAGAGGLGVIDEGGVYDRVRGATIAGVDGSLGVVVPLGLGFDARLTASYQRWFSSFAPVPGDAYVAGGAVDERAHVEVASAYVF
jgi:hypothetical protein